MTYDNHYKKKDIFSKNQIKNIALSLLIIIVFFGGQGLIAQVGVGNTDPQATLDITAADPDNPANTDGILVPRVNTLNTTGPNADQDGMLVYLTTDVTISKLPIPKASIIGMVLYLVGFSYHQVEKTP